MNFPKSRFIFILLFLLLIPILSFAQENDAKYSVDDAVSKANTFQWFIIIITILITVAMFPIFRKARRRLGGKKDASKIKFFSLYNRYIFITILICCTIIAIVYVLDIFGWKNCSSYVFDSQNNAYYSADDRLEIQSPWFINLGSWVLSGFATVVIISQIVFWFLWLLFIKLDVLD